jgi:hypothetical protein
VRLCRETKIKAKLSVVDFEYIIIIFQIYQIREIAHCRGKQMKDVFCEFKQAICKFAVNTIHDIQSTNPSAKKSMEVITEVANVFDYRDIQTFLMVQYLLKRI